MLVAILGDTHFGARGDNPVFHQYFKRFYDNVFFPYLKEHNILDIIQLGDVFDRRKFVNFNSLKQSKDYFFNTLNNEYSSWLLTGNHDTYFKNTNEVNSPDLLLGEYHNINLVNEPLEVEFDGAGILLMPWISQDNAQRCFNALKSSKSQIVMGHFEIEGFEMHKGAYCDEGINPQIFDKFDMVISGHFHTRSFRGNITYTGTPYEMTWSDYGDPKGFHILDTETRELKFIQNPYCMFHKLWYDDNGKSMDEILAQDLSPYKNAIVKLIITNKLNTLWFDMYVEKLEKAGIADLQIVEDHLNLNLEDDADIVNEAEDTLTILSKYVNQLDIKADKGKLNGLLRTLYNQALSME
jgi:DNA repair exonuclease SbcCD nuclease subunit